MTQPASRGRPLHPSCAPGLGRRCVTVKNKEGYMKTGMHPEKPHQNNVLSTGLRRRPGRPAVTINLEQLQEFRKQGLSVRKIGRLMRVSKSSIWAALRRPSKTNKDVSKNS